MFLSAKPHQETFPWREYQCSIYVYYRKINQVAHSFVFPIPRCDGVVQDIDTEAKYFILVDMYRGNDQKVVAY